MQSITTASNPIRIFSNGNASSLFFLFLLTDCILCNSASAQRHPIETCPSSPFPSICLPIFRRSLYSGSNLPKWCRDCITICHNEKCFFMYCFIKFQINFKNITTGLLFSKLFLFYNFLLFDLFFYVTTNLLASRFQRM